MKRLLMSFPLLLVLAAVAVTPATASSGNVQFLLGQRTFNDDWRPVDRQWLLGVQGDWGEEDWPVHIAWGFTLSAAQEEPTNSPGFEFTTGVGSLSFGAVWVPLQDSAFRPYLGAGIEYAYASYELDIDPPSYDDTDGSLGYYLNGGLFWRLGPQFNLGLDVRLGRGASYDFEVPVLFSISDTATLSGNYTQYALLLGFGWPNR
jgi:hypothetical protein